MLRRLFKSSREKPNSEPNFDELLKWLHHTMTYLNLYPSYVEKLEPNPYFYDDMQDSLWK